MEESIGFGDEFGRRLRAQATSFVRSLHNINIAVTEVRAESPEHGISASQVREDAFLVAVMLTDYPSTSILRMAGLQA